MSVTFEKYASDPRTAALPDTYPTGADKSDKLNQTRVVAWKVFYGTILLNQNFFMRIESGSGFSPNPDSGAFTIVN